MARSSGMYHRSKDCIRAAVLRIYWYEEGGPRNFVLSFWVMNVSSKIQLFKFHAKQCNLARNLLNI